MKKVVPLIGLSMIMILNLVACNSSEMNKESDIIERQDVEYVNEYKKFIKDGDEYLACGKLDKAEEAYMNAKEYNPILEEAYFKLLSMYEKGYNVDNKNAIIQEVDKNVIDISDELKKLVEEERRKDWFPTNVIVKKSDGEVEFNSTFEYDSNGRIIKSKVGSIPMENGFILGTDFEYTYLEDGSIKISEYYGERYRGSKIYKLDDFGRVVWIQNISSYRTEYEPTEYYYESDDAILPYGSEATLDKYGFITKDHPSSNNTFVNECDRYGNLVRKYVYKDGSYVTTYAPGGSKVTPNVKTKYQDGYLLQYQEYTYVYCKPEELQGDLSAFPKTDVSQVVY